MSDLFPLLTVAGSAALLVAERAGSLRAIAVLKPIASSGFVLTAWSRHALDHSAGRWLMAGLILGLIGDLFLVLKHDKRMFLAGLVSFLLGHLAYVVTFAVRGVDGGAAAASLGVLVPAALLVLRWLWPHAGRLRAPVVAYVVVISAMMAAAVGAWARGDTPLVVVGAGLFYLSDLGVARERFVVRAFANKLVGQPLYFAGQLVLALALAAPVAKG